MLLFIFGFKRSSAERRTVMEKKYSLDMTCGPFMKKIIIFAVPLILTGLLQLAYNTADIVVVGRFAGSEALAAVGSTGSLINLLLNVFIGLSMGSGVMIARHIGARDDKRVHESVHTAMLMSVVCGFAVAFIGFFASAHLLRLMKSPEDVLPLATLYLKIYFIGSPGSFVYNFGSSIVRATGDTKKPLIILALTGLINVALNLILVIFFHMGVSGVAIATIASQYVSAIWIVIHLMKMNNACKLKFSKLRIYKSELFSIFKIGLPAGIQSSLFSISNVIIQSTVNSFGSVAMAGIAAGSNYDSYIFTAANAITQTAMTFTSQNMGARKFENIGKIYRYCLTTTAVIGSVLCAVGYFFSEPIVSFFSSDPAVIEIGAQRLELVIPFFVFCSMMDVAAGQLRGMGQSFAPMVVALAGSCGLRLLWVFVFLPMNHTLMYLYWAYPISWTVTFFAQFLLYFIVKHRMKKKGLMD